MKKFLITNDTVANGKKVAAGDVIELPEHVGHELCGYNKAEVYIEKTKAKKENRSVGLKTSKTKPLKTKSKE